MVCYGRSVQIYNPILQFQSEESVSEQPLLTGMRPFLNLATICERYILESDGVLTLFRIVDRFTVTGATPEMPLSTISFNLVVNFRAGDFRGPLDLGIHIVAPSEIPVQELRLPVIFEAPDEKGVQMIGQIHVGVKEPGLYWIVVKLAEEEYTRIPLRIVYQRLPTIQTGS
jgi:hypothetical protein